LSAPRGSLLFLSKNAQNDRRYGGFGWAGRALSNYANLD